MRSGYCRPGRRRDPRACRCGHWLRAHQHLPGAEGCGRCPCPTFRPPRVTHRNWVLRALVAAMVLLGLAAATALLTTRPAEGARVRRGIAAQPSIEKVASGSPTDDR